MLDKLILIIISILSYMVTSNAISKQKIMKRHIASTTKVMLSIGVSIFLFLVISFIAESIINTNFYIDVSIEGIFIGWTVALSSVLQRARKKEKHRHK